jgi:hypothetical protein
MDFHEDEMGYLRPRYGWIDLSRRRTSVPVVFFITVSYYLELYFKFKVHCPLAR